MASELIYKADARKAILKENPSIAYCIDNIKGVDAVEVVRCKDCRHYKFRKPYPSYNATVKTCCRCANTRVNDDDFCSYGERKDNEVV
jgi:hypothetical protein